MRALVIFDSSHKNTDLLAHVIGSSVGAQADEILWVGGVAPAKLKDRDLLIVGSSSHRGKPTLALQGFFQVIDPDLKGIEVAAFDTRVARRLPSLFGYAAGWLAKEMEARGGTLVAPPQGFLIEGSEGPLREGEIERAADWAQKLLV
jgi:flavodoxin